MDDQKHQKAEGKRPKLGTSDFPVLPEAELFRVTERFTSFVRANLSKRRGLHKRLAEFDQSQGNERR
ncbi:MAG: hypothetical protein ACD_13C00025G0002 [uncultured bacterium]|nr:MAG: hypothetical protein ACD_13C00025G0002 [uncultured bacterium]